MKKLVKIVLFLSFIFLLGACGKKNVKKEITVYTALEENLLEDYISAFNEEYPDIKLNIISDGTGNIIAKLIAEKDNPQADVIWSLSQVMILEKYNLLKPYSPKGSENVSEIFKDNSKSPKWVGISAWMVALGINLKEYKTFNIPEIKSYYDILNSKLDNQILMANPTSSGTGYLTVNTLINLLGEEKAWEYMDNLNKNIATYTSSGNAPVQIVGRGEKTIGFIPAYQGITMEKEGKLPLKVVFPQEGLGWELEANALVNKKEVKPEAKMFLDWSLSDKFMKLHSKTRGFVTIAKYRNTEGYPNDVENYLKPRNFARELENRDRILKEWAKRYGKGE